MTTYSQSALADLLARHDVALERLVHVAEVGSTAHGINTSETGDDLDLTVVRVEDFSELVVGESRRQSMMIRTQPEGMRSHTGDIDLQVYTLRKFATLAASGNPSILAAIFSQRVHHSAALDLHELADRVASKRAGAAFLGYMQQQIERWKGTRGQKNVTRPELVEAYGFDTKYAAHVIRLGWQGIEYMESGRFTMPMPEPFAGIIRDVRTGGRSEAEAMGLAQDAEVELKRTIERSLLPDHPAVISVDAWVVDHYRRLVVTTGDVVTGGMV